MSNKAPSSTRIAAAGPTGTAAGTHRRDDAAAALRDGGDVRGPAGIVSSPWRGSGGEGAAQAVWTPGLGVERAGGGGGGG